MGLESTHSVFAPCMCLHAAALCTLHEEVAASKRSYYEADCLDSLAHHCMRASLQGLLLLYIDTQTRVARAPYSMGSHHTAWTP